MTPGESAVFGSRESHSVSASKSKVSMTAQRAPFGHGDDGIRFVKVPPYALPARPRGRLPRMILPGLIGRPCQVIYTVWGAPDPERRVGIGISCRYMACLTPQRGRAKEGT